jgi:hypothetical protein
VHQVVFCLWLEGRHPDALQGQIFIGLTIECKLHN